MNVETSLLMAPEAASRTFARALKTALLQTATLRKLTVAVIFCFALAGQGAFAQGSSTFNPIPINNTNFPDDDFRDSVAKFDTNPADGFLSIGEIAAVTSINLRGSSITRLEGIQYFTSLEELNCNYNFSITKIDTLPKNLRELYCNNCISLLALSDSLSDSLRTMQVRNCKLTTLPTLPDSLKELRCDVNKLTTLPELPEKLSLLKCDNNDLDSLPALPASLVILECANNHLTSLDLSGFSASDDFSFIGSGQKAYIPLIWDNNTNGYSKAISLNNPFSGNTPNDEVYYDATAGILRSRNTSRASADFSVSTGSGTPNLDGTLYFTYAYIDLANASVTHGAGWEADNNKYFISPDTNVVVSGKNDGNGRYIYIPHFTTARVTLRDATINHLSAIALYHYGPQLTLTVEGVDTLAGINAAPTGIATQLTIDGTGVLTSGTIAAKSFTLNGDVVVFAPYGITTESSTYTKGILFNGNKGTVSGHTKLPNNVTIPAGDTLTIPNGATLDITANYTLTNNGAIIPANGSTVSIAPSGVAIYGKISGANVNHITKDDSTYNSIKINKSSLLANTGQSIEYGYKAANATGEPSWTTDPSSEPTLTFTGFTPSTAYKIFARSRENAHFAAGASDSITISTAAAYNVTVERYVGATQSNDGGSASANPNSGVPKNGQVTLEIQPTSGYALDTVYVINTTTPPDTIPHSISGLNRIFTMPDHDVKAKVIFKKTADLLAVEAANDSIVDIKQTWEVADTANTAEAVMRWLRDSITHLISPQNVTVGSINILSPFNPATSGTAGAPNGINGSFTFTVALVKGSVTAHTSIRSGIIRATPYVGAAQPQITAQPLDTTIVKQGDQIAALSITTAALTDGGVLSYQWYSNTTNSTTGGTAIADSVRNEFIPSTAVADTFYYYVVAKNTNAGITNGPTEASDTSDVAVVIVYPRIALPLIASHPQSVDALKGNRIKLSVEAISPDDGALTYQWYRNATNSNSGGTAIADSVRSEFVPSTAAVDTSYYYVMIKNALNGQDTIVASNVARVTVRAAHKIKIASLENGAITASADSAAATSAITLTIAPSAGYTLDTLYVIGGAADTIAHSGSGDARAFVMPADSVTVSAFFRKTQPQLDKEAVETAKTAIERGSYRILQANGNDEASIRSRLVDEIRQFFGSSHDLEVRSATPTHVDVVVTTITPAIAGAENATLGTNGSFKFFAVLSRGATTLTTVEVQGVIVATPHSSDQTKRIELSSNELTVRIANTGNVALGEHTIVLSGANSSQFALGVGGEKTIDRDDLAVGADYYLTLVPVGTLAAGTYNLTVIVNGESLNPSPSISIVYVKAPTGIEGLPEASQLKARAGNGRLYVKGLTQGQPWSVYSISGSLVYRNTAASDEAEIALPTKGVYVVVSGAESVKTVY